MRLAVITHVQHIQKEGRYFGYGPYVREMNLWLRHVEEVEIVAPLVEKEISAIHLPYQHSNISFSRVTEFNITSVAEIIKTVFRLPLLFWRIYKAMKEADHIHLRCPGNMGLLGAIIQIFFPRTPKTAKYAGNWDPLSKQPYTYRLQRWILSNTFLTRNMQVLVYGEWPNSSKNIRSFFTATYSEEDKIKNLVSECESAIKRLEELHSGTKRFLFVGTLSKGKQPLYAVKLVEKLIREGVAAQIELFGEGKMRAELENYIRDKNLGQYVLLQGNQTKEVVEDAYRSSHFMVLPSMSEGWPKVVAEAMFWGCVPIATAVSCVPYMMDYNKRGLLLEMDAEKDSQKVNTLIDNPQVFMEMSNQGKEWSREFTLEKFEAEIQKLIH